MKCYVLFFALLLCGLTAISQTAVTAVTTSTAPASTTFSYSDAGNTYNWGLSPDNTVTSLTTLTAGGVPYTYANFINGTVKLRRVNNAVNTDSVTLVWAETVTSTPTTFNMLADYQNDLEAFLDNHIYNKGADNLFDNTNVNSNNVERFDWIFSGGYSTPMPAQTGFPVFERGNVGTHDSVCIAAITSLDGLGNPATYGAIVRIGKANYGDPVPTVTYRVFKATYPANLLDQGVNPTQSRGGVFVSLQDLGVAPATTIYGYSLFSGDLPAIATSTDLVDYTNTTFFPTNTGPIGGIELLAVNGIVIASSVLPTRFITFDAVENNNIVNLKWTVENETSVNKYEIERSTDGINYLKINEVKSAGNTGSNSYTVPDNVSSVSSNQIYYRIKQYEQDGSYYLSKTIAIKRNKGLSIVMYPNPVIKALYVNIPSTSVDKGIISVTNSIGAQVISQQIKLANGNNSFTVDRVSGLPTGMYQLSVKLNSGKTVVKQFSKQ